MSVFDGRAHGYEKENIIKWKLHLTMRCVFDGRANESEEENIIKGNCYDGPYLVFHGRANDFDQKTNHEVEMPLMHQTQFAQCTISIHPGGSF